MLERLNSGHVYTHGQSWAGIEGRQSVCCVMQIVKLLCCGIVLY